MGWRWEDHGPMARRRLPPWGRDRELLGLTDTSYIRPYLTEQVRSFEETTINEAPSSTRRGVFLSVHLDPIPSFRLSALSVLLALEPWNLGGWRIIVHTLPSHRRVAKSQRSRCNPHPLPCACFKKTLFFQKTQASVFLFLQIPKLPRGKTIVKENNKKL